ncbi:hypothetical protein GIB67_019448, partial [Kingdonia uniflora]
RTPLNKVLAYTMAANKTPIGVGTRENDPVLEGEDDTSCAPYAFESQKKIMTSSSHAVAGPPLTSSTIARYKKFRGRLQDFQKSSTVQISCIFCGMKTKRLGYILNTCVNPLEHRPLDFVDKFFSNEGFDMTHLS